MGGCTFTTDILLYAGADLPDLWSNIMSSNYPSTPLPLYPSTPLVCTQCLGFSATLPPGQVRLFYVTGAEQRVVRAKETKKEKRWTP